MRFTGDRTGMRYGKLTVVNSAGVFNGRGRWTCRCDCGKVSIVLTGNLKHAQSCGCLRAADPNNPPKSSLNEYNILYGMINRCHSETSPYFKDYGARGIRVCAEWRSNFALFLAHMGKRPSLHHSVERIDNSVGYEPGNVRWATKEEQNNNSRRNRYVSYRGRQVTFANAMKMANSTAHRMTIKERIENGWPTDDAFEKPPQRKRKG